MRKPSRAYFRGSYDDGLTDVNCATGTRHGRNAAQPRSRRHLPTPATPRWPQKSSAEFRTSETLRFFVIREEKPQASKGAKSALPRCANPAEHRSDLGGSHLEASIRAS